MKLKYGYFLYFLIGYARGQLLIGAFNIRIFGQSKVNKPEVVDILVKIVQRYDIVLVQEIRDRKQTAFPKFVDLVNQRSRNRYLFVQSPRTGRTRIKEQYGFIYRSSSVRLVSLYQYPDFQDIFEREPFVVQFERTSTSGGAQRRFAFLALHAKPSEAVGEMNALVDVYGNISSLYGEDVLLGGDFNADCSYVCSSCWDRVGLWTDQRFTWLIDSEADTSVAASDCAYDRMVVAGSSLTSQSRNATIFRYDLAYNLTNSMAKKVSDHYPVEFYLD